MRKTTKTKSKRVQSFIQELAWVFDSFKDVSFKDVYECYSQQCGSENSSIRIAGETQYLVGVLPKLFQDNELFPKKEDILDFSEQVLGLSLSRAAKRSRIEYIGMIVCEVSNSDSYRLGKLVEALEKLIGNEAQMQKVKKARKEQNFSWNDTIAKLGEGL